MINWLDFFYFFTCGAALLLSGLGLWFVVIMPGIGRWSKHFFRTYFIVLMLICFSTFLEMILQRYAFPREAMVFWLALESLLLPLPIPMLTVYLLHCTGENLRTTRLFFIMMVLWAIYSVLVIGSPFIRGFSKLTPDGQYARGPLYPLLILPLTLLMLCNLAGTIMRRGRLSRKAWLSFLIAELPMAAALTVHLFTDVYPLIDICIVLSALSMYGIILSDQIEQDLRHQQEIANQRASIMVLQMRPHYIYNTMTSIYCLCNQDPERARQVILDFTTYLRKNFTAIASSEPIPFSAELEHVRAYLAVEQAQYDDSLSVEYDTPHIRFRVPPLTLQPIVENAVKHGRDPYAGVFHLLIRTRKTATGSEIIIADNGRGFAPSDDSEPHIALKNIRQRLEMMCRGSLAITRADGGGTIVTVTIPDAAKSHPS